MQDFIFTMYYKCLLLYFHYLPINSIKKNKNYKQKYQNTQQKKHPTSAVIFKKQDINDFLKENFLPFLEEQISNTEKFITENKIKLIHLKKIEEDFYICVNEKAKNTSLEVATDSPPNHLKILLDKIKKITQLQTELETINRDKNLKINTYKKEYR